MDPNNINLERDSIDQTLRDGAELHILKPDYAYLQIGNSRYYFHGNVTKQEVTTFSGEKLTKSILPYDGWERGV